jgi:2-keto-4-pentenoate hydratase/2-oxohepta-3-ene-1,7-dioic acid hydratase in catechol pathway
MKPFLPALAAGCLLAALPTLAADEQAMADAARQTAMGMQKAHAGKVLAKIEKGGPVSAIGVCATIAPEVAAVVSRQNGWRVTRVSLKVRNPVLGAADAWEQQVLREFDERIARGRPGLDRARQILDCARKSPALVPAEALFKLDDVHFLPPIPDPGKFLCVGKNYRSHLEELTRTDLIKEMPDEPTGFVKISACLTGHDTEVERPATVSRLDYEPELVFVIGKPCYGGSRENAFDYLAGITILNDLTCRDTQ